MPCRFITTKRHFKANREKKLHNVDKLFSTNLSLISNEGVFLKANGYKAVKINCTIQSLHDDINKYGSLLFSTDTIGRHLMIIDELNNKEKYATVRDPFHGWSITISLGYFDKTVFKGECYHLEKL